MGHLQALCELNYSMRHRNATPPEKPNEDFPLFPHRNGQWAKKILGKLHYFGRWEEPQSAVEKYLADRDYLHNGLEPPNDGETIADLLNSFRGSKKRAMEREEISERTYEEYSAICDTIVSVFGKTRPVESLKYHDLDRLRTILGKGKRGKRVRPLTHKRLLTYARMVFHHATERMGIPVKYRDALAPPVRE